jgi:hypothetical protein
MNILNKTNRSIAPTFGDTTNGVAKREKFSWSNPCKPGTFLMVRKEDLNIDGTYQREEVSALKVREIASEWDWKLYGVLSVILRPDGTLWVYDGGHRCRAAFLRDDITELPCMVFSVSDRIDEARAFLGTNLIKTFVSAYHKHRAAVLTGEPVAKVAAAILSKHGYIVSTNSGKNEFAAINTLQKIAKEDAVTAERVFSACIVIAGSNQDAISGDILEGLFRCQKKLEGNADILTNGHLEKLAKETLPGIGAAIRRERHIIGKGGATIAAKAILDLLNKGKQRRLTFA